MTTSEFSNEFDVLYNNISSNQAPGLDEYEKSVFLTKAQNEIVKNYFTAESTGNTIKKGFDDTAKRQIDFSNLIVTSIPNLASNQNTRLGNNITEGDSKFYEFPKDTIAILNEYMIVNRGGNTIRLSVVPITYTEYNRLISKPYKFPPKNQAWRLISSPGIAQIIVGNNDNFIKVQTGPNTFAEGARGYEIRYVKYPRPIVLTDLPTGLSIHNTSIETGCELTEEVHADILQRAVELAKIAYQGDVASVTQLGTRAE